MKNTFKWIAIVFIAIIALAIIVNVSSGSDANPINEDETATETTTWKYTEDVDKMDNTPRYFANNTSINKVSFDFPYNGGSMLKITIRNMGKGNEVVLRISKGQFMTDVMGTLPIRAKFDDNTISKYTYLSATDGSVDIIFIQDADDFINKIKGANKVLIGATFFNEGEKHFEFETSGLKWEH